LCFFVILINTDKPVTYKVIFTKERFMQKAWNRLTGNKN